MKIIKLTKNQETIVDDKYYEYLNTYIWYACIYHIQDTIPKYRVKRYRKNNKNNSIYLHREIMELEGYSIKNKLIDHINGNSLDNRIKNLRIANYSQNASNSKLRNNNTSGYKGVCWSKKHNKWLVRIKYNKKSIYIGMFNSIIDAANAYDKASIKYHKEFASPNFKGKIYV